MAKPKKYRYRLMITVEVLEISAEPHEETRPIVEELQTRPWYRADDERQRRTRKGERHSDERPR